MKTGSRYFSPFLQRHRQKSGRGCNDGKLEIYVQTVTIQGAASEVMNLGLYLSGVDLAAEGEVERIDQLAERLEHMSEVDCDKFAGMLDANSISGTKDISQLTERLDDYVILPGCGSAHSIGRYLVCCGAFPVPEKLIGYINYEAVGIEFATRMAAQRAAVDSLCARRACRRQFWMICTPQSRHTK